MGAGGPGGGGGPPMPIIEASNSAEVIRSAPLMRLSKSRPPNGSSSVAEGSLIPNENGRLEGLWGVHERMAQNSVEDSRGAVWLLLLSPHGIPVVSRTFGIEAPPLVTQGLVNGLFSAASEAGAAITCLSSEVP